MDIYLPQLILRNLWTWILSKPSQRCHTLRWMNCDVYEGFSLHDPTSRRDWVGFLSFQTSRRDWWFSLAAPITAWYVAPIYTESRTSRKLKRIQERHDYLHYPFSFISGVAFTGIMRNIKMDPCSYNWGHKTFVIADKGKFKPVTM